VLESCSRQDPSRNSLDPCQHLQQMLQEGSLGAAKPVCGYTQTSTGGLTCMLCVCGLSLAGCSALHGQGDGGAS